MLEQDEHETLTAFEILYSKLRLYLNESCPSLAKHRREFLGNQ